MTSGKELFLPFLVNYFTLALVRNNFRKAIEVSLVKVVSVDRAEVAGSITYLFIPSRQKLLFLFIRPATPALFIL